MNEHSIPNNQQEINQNVVMSPCTDIVSPEHSFPEFPKEAYIGVLADFAELYSQHYESPKEFFYIDAITVAGTAISGLVSADFPELDPYTRLHVLKIGPSGTSKKSTSFRIARKFVTKAIVAAERFKRSGTKPSADIAGVLAAAENSLLPNVRPRAEQILASFDRPGHGHEVKVP